MLLQPQHRELYNSAEAVPQTKTHDCEKQLMDDSNNKHPYLELLKQEPELPKKIAELKEIVVNGVKYDLQEQAAPTQGDSLACSDGIVGVRPATMKSPETADPQKASPAVPGFWSEDSAATPKAKVTRTTADLRSIPATPTCRKFSAEYLVLRERAMWNVAKHLAINKDKIFAAIMRHNVENGLVIMRCENHVSLST
jgi:hypothetical protein